MNSNASSNSNEVCPLTRQGSGAAAGADLLITGELEHVMYHPAYELRMPVLALGHYATETLGPRAVMEYIGRKFDVACEFADFPTSL
ncbi:hypothetical protein C5Q97_09540 [Victivallales bacterium CCUG 44730]|nr:hypothetical protein C5Q97_09540 [Victivallales bacterium CCUG 44730]